MRLFLFSLGLVVLAVSFVSFKTAQTHSMAVASPVPWGDEIEINVAKEIWIRNPDVLDDPIRTRFNANSTNPNQAAWTFGRMMENMAGDHEPEIFTARLFQHFEEEQQDINGQTLAARPTFTQEVIEPWRNRTVGEGLDPELAPMRLNGIVNRIDLRKTVSGTEFHAGEGRLVYGILDANGGLTQRTIILEYELIADDCQAILNWANRWHTLGQIEGVKEYNDALAAIVNRFAGKNAAPERTNGSAILTVRTNDVGGMQPEEEWQWREFRMNPDTGFLSQSTVAMTPAHEHNNTNLLAQFVRQNRPAILNDAFEIPLVFRGTPFLGADSVDLANGDEFLLPQYGGPLDLQARHILSLNTCAGCHGNETPSGTGRLHVRPRQIGEEPLLSNFLLGGFVNDPVSGKQRYFNELNRRRDDFKLLLESSCEEVELLPTYSRVH